MPRPCSPSLFSPHACNFRHRSVVPCVVASVRQSLVVVASFFVVVVVFRPSSRRSRRAHRRGRRRRAQRERENRDERARRASRVSRARPRAHRASHSVVASASTRRQRPRPSDGSPGRGRGWIDANAVIDTARVVSRTRHVDTARLLYINHVGSSAAPRTRAKSRRRGRVADGHACPCVIYYDTGMYTHIGLRASSMREKVRDREPRTTRRPTDRRANERARARATDGGEAEAESGERRAESRGEEGASEDRARTASRWTTP